MKNIVEAQPDDIWIIQLLAKRTWPDTFKDILSPDQIEYMIDMMYSAESLQKQLKEGHHYLLVSIDGEYLGYTSYELNHTASSSCKIHKIYVLPSAQGLGLGKYLIQEVEKRANENSQNTLKLNVNRSNKAIAFYKHNGFEVEYEENIDIGNGFLMEDYVMSKKI